MPLTLLTEAALETYGQYTATPNPEQLLKFFVLEPRDLELVRHRRREHNKVGMAVQLCTLRFLGTFVDDLQAVPLLVVRFVARQLGLSIPQNVKRYARRPNTRSRHQRLVREHLGYTTLTPFETFSLMRWMYGQLLLGNLDDVRLFDLTTQRLITRKVMLPAASTLATLVTRVRHRTSLRVFEALSRRLNPEQTLRLEAVLLVPEGQYKSTLDTLRDEPSDWKVSDLYSALDKLEAIRTLGVGAINLSDLSSQKLRELSEEGMTLWADTLAKYGQVRRRATLLAWAQHLEHKVMDDVLTVFDRHLRGLELRSLEKNRKARLRGLKDLDRAAKVLSRAVKMLLEWPEGKRNARKAILKQLEESRLKAAVERVEALTHEESEIPQAWGYAQKGVARFLPRFLEVISFEGTPLVKPLLEAIAFVKSGSLETPELKDAPKAFMSPLWQARVFLEGGEVEVETYLLVLAIHIQMQLKKRELFVSKSLQHGDPRTGLLEGEAWESQRVNVCRLLGRSPDSKAELESLSKTLDTAYQTVLEGLPTNTALKLVQRKGHTVAVLKPLPAQPSSPGLKALGREMSRRLPFVELSDLLLEVHSYTGFAQAFLRTDEKRDTRHNTPELELSVCAVLLAQACNLSLRAVARPEVPALTLEQLHFVQQHYIRKDTLKAANAMLVESHSGLPLVQHWGTGDMASADGMRFQVAVKSLHSGYNRKYFGIGRGVTLFSFTSDQFSGFWGRVVPGTLPDSLNILHGILTQDTVLEPKTYTTDTSSYTDAIFGLFHLLGLQFAPRIANMSHSRYWRMDREADYGALDDLARHKVNTSLIVDQWDDLLRLAGSLKLGIVAAPDILKTLTRGGTLTGLGRAVEELGKIAKTLHLLAYLHDEAYRRAIQIQLNRGESRQGVARVVYHGRQGELRQRYQQGMEDQLSALGLVVNAIVLWNTRYMQAILDWLEGIGEEFDDADLARLSPLKYAHINMIGRYHFTLPEDVRLGAMRPLRDPDTLELYERLENAA